MQVRLEEWAEAEERLRNSVLSSFRTQPQIAKQEEILHGRLDRTEGDKIRLAVTAALRAGLTIGDAERSALQPLGAAQWTEASQRVESQFETPLAIPDRDLAVYTPQGTEHEPSTLEDQVEEVARLARESLTSESDSEDAMRKEIVEAIEEKRSLQRQIPQETSQTEIPLESEIDSEPVPEALAVPPAEPEEPFVLEPLPTVDLSDWDLAAAMDPSRLTPLPLVAAALEAVGLDEDQFGFLLRYGTLAPKGRTSEIKIAGLGMAEFSNRAAEWFNALGTSKFPIQVIDDGSGQLTVYLLESVPA